MKEYSNNFVSKEDEYNISVRTNKNMITLGIDIGCDGFFADLTTKEVDSLIQILKEAKKKAICS